MDAIVEVLQQLLPKGIVFDSPAIYAEVAKLPVVPLEDIHRHWKTYTTTHKNLHDPTACRLENFWWHVWGSNRRELSGETLARLWEEIASGPTFVPLRGPPNRWEGPPPVKPTRSMHESDTIQPPQTKAPQQQYIQASIPKGTPHNLTPSSARPPPPHPILKKPSGPSSTGPRPTARFADVLDSEGEASQPSAGKNVQGSNKKKVDTRPASSPVAPAKVDKKPTATAKKFVVSTTASKRRPALPRRQSSQSSTGSVTASTTGPTNGPTTGSRDPTSGSKLAANQQGPAPGTKEISPSRKQGGSGLSTHAKGPASSAKAPAKRPTVPSPEKQPAPKSSQQTGSQAGLQNMTPQQTLSPTLKESSGKENSLRSQSGSGDSRPSAKALGKQPETPVGSGKQSSLRKSNQMGSFDGPGPQPSPPRSEPQHAPTNAPSNHQEAETTDERRDSSQQENVQARKELGRKASSSAAPMMVRSRSNNEAKRLSSASFKSASVVGLSSIAVTGGFDFETPKARPAADDMPPLAADQPDIRASSVLDSRLTPTQPSPAPAPPLGRSKSQLTLLLQRERTRIGERTRAGSNSSRRSDSSREDGHQEGKKKG
ncbi:hypothetical protein VMCG_08504 [Cytospora schulzeri]|uniref:Nitrogen regulatory protein areA GATA-like domain-containing protein n=1 Tax=Cytospora schulzeri TaxID=448051 RepID=A0A423VWR8_9PEZI|nr:hypothetical protein VMCG_08504 [Valsa malicola]